MGINENGWDGNFDELPVDEAIETDDTNIKKKKTSKKKARSYKFQPEVVKSIDNLSKSLNMGVTKVVVLAINELAKQQGISSDSPEEITLHALNKECKRLGKLCSLFVREHFSDTLDKELRDKAIAFIKEQIDRGVDVKADGFVKKLPDDIKKVIKTRRSLLIFLYSYVI